MRTVSVLLTGCAEAPPRCLAEPIEKASLSLLDRFATREEVGREFAAAGAPHERCSAKERPRAGPPTRSVLPQRRRREAAYPRPSATRYALHILRK